MAPTGTNHPVFRDLQTFLGNILHTSSTTQTISPLAHFQEQFKYHEYSDPYSEYSWYYRCMISRPAYIEELSAAVRRSRITVILGPRQCGKTTLARTFGASKHATLFDLESGPDLQRLQNPEMSSR